ncbi:hypothetical protein Tco_1004256 [Tanacetum coccineum]|uniref:Uncharacterized protein n=1 Tax=Tanacetum coccineum TaxID=301880 RepID=A0ABQ5FCS9_9ASTR
MDEGSAAANSVMACLGWGDVEQTHLVSNAFVILQLEGTGSSVRSAEERWRPELGAPLPRLFISSFSKTSSSLSLSDDFIILKLVSFHCRIVAGSPSGVLFNPPTGLKLAM